MDLDHLYTLVCAARDEAKRLNTDGPAYAALLGYIDATTDGEDGEDGDGPTPTRVIAEQLAGKNITPEVIAGYEMIQTAVTALLVSADRDAAKNYIEITLDGVRAPFDRAAVHLIRPGGKTPHELRLMAESETRGVQVEVQFAQSTIEDRDRALSQARAECERWRIDTGLLVHEMHVPKDGESVVDCVLRTITALRKYNAARTQELARLQPLIAAAKELAPHLEGTGDWACRECRPGTDWPHEGFRCRPHALKHALDAALATEKPDE